jgi:beta-alanine degradation protein BauB
MNDTKLEKEKARMNRRNVQLLGAVALVLAATAAIAGSEAQSRSLPVTQLQYAPTGISDNVHGEVKAAAAFGDASRGAHSTFLKLPAGFVSPVHAHTNDYWAVVVSGVAANGKPGDPDIALPPGSYFFQKGGEQHVTKCLSANECIVFLSQSGKYDFVPAAK